MLNNLYLKYPIYIISKGRYINPLTAKIFLKENINFKIAVEPQEYENYCKAINPKFILKLPFSNLGMGSTPARNYCWEHSTEGGCKKHFIFDDNIYGFSKLKDGNRTNCNAIDALLNLEKISDKFKNLAISGFNYTMFVTKATKKAFFINTHVYSGLLINNKIPFRWRLKYNEDIDLNLQALHNQWCTILLNAFLIKKVSTTAKMKGGNQDELYLNNRVDKKKLKANSIREVWPQYVKVMNRFNRPHHQISWTKFFKHPLIKF